MIRRWLGIPLAFVLGALAYGASALPSDPLVWCWSPVGALVALLARHGWRGPATLLGMVATTSEALSDDAEAVISGAWWGVLPGIFWILAPLARPGPEELGFDTSLLRQLLTVGVSAGLLSALVLPLRWQARD